MQRPPYPQDDSESAMPSAPAMPMPSPNYGDKGGAKMGGGLGAGVEAPEGHDIGEAGFKCEAKFPLTGEFWTRDPEHGQA